MQIAYFLFRICPNEIEQVDRLKQEGIYESISNQTR